MTYLSWEKDLDVKIKGINIQHKSLVDLLNKLYDALKRNSPDTLINHLFDSFLEFTTDHFKSEERLFEEHGYPDLEKHKIEHKLFLQTLTKSKTEITSREINQKTLEVIRHWFIDHIITDDMKAGEYLASKGLT